MLADVDGQISNPTGVVMSPAEVRSAIDIAQKHDLLLISDEIYEPFLIQIGFLDRTPRGRVATRLAYEHLGIEMPRKLSLF